MRISTQSDSLSMIPFRQTAAMTKPALAAGATTTAQSTTAEPDATPAASLSPTATSTGWRRMSFDVDLNSRAIRVTVSDQNSGEVYRELVYDRSGRLRLPNRPDAGRWIDRAV